MNKFIILCCISITSSFAIADTITSMTKEQIIREIINKTFVSIPTDNLNGKTINNTFSMFMDDKGGVLGKMGHKPINEPQVDMGIYNISQDGTIYFTWKHWDGSKKLCFHIFKTQNTYLSIGCDNVFHTAFMKANIQLGNHL